MIWKHIEAGTADVGRGMAGDIDPRFPGMEVWAFSGVYNAPTNRLTESTPRSPVAADRPVLGRRHQHGTAQRRQVREVEPPVRGSVRGW